VLIRYFKDDSICRYTEYTILAWSFNVMIEYSKIPPVCYKLNFGVKLHQSAAGTAVNVKLCAV